ncbi:hypothetical protein SJAV_13320 [Sulfurisphaera javensis]|uniref:Predicted DNA-binding protein ribbon-helix-helix domain-containing protein n=1 Tax=Sulfurisphaera javensis TaxID=2049879 RepID=A0AAT9GRD2_9CREN
MVNTKSFKLNLTPEKYETLKRISKQTGVSMNDIIRLAIDRYLKEASS